MYFHTIKPNLIIFKTTRQGIQGINPKLTYEASGKSFELPRFLSTEMKQARIMNNVAKNNKYQYYSNIIPPKASPQDIKRLTSENMENSYNRAVWINPKDSKAYYLLKEKENKNGSIQLRILNQKGEFVKNANVTPQEIILTDLEKGQKPVIQVTDFNLCHTDFIEILAKRHNPFAKYKTIHIKNDDEIVNLKNIIQPDTSCISMSYGVYHKKPTTTKRGNDIQDTLLNNIQISEPNEITLLEKLKKLSKKVRVLASAGNGDKDEVAGILLKTGFEGVGGINSRGTVDINSG